MKIRQYLLDRQAEMQFSGIPAAELHVESIHHTFTHVVTLEEQSTQNIFNLMKLAKQKEDYMTESFLQWFVDKQVEEESTAQLLQERSKDRSAHDFDMFIKLNGMLPSSHGHHKHQH
ncbi:hypothetical protein RCL1_005024 [Eukaryota sp. TZLM3-RCL]